MTSADLAAAAVANRQKRMAQLAALHPVKKEANQRADELAQQVDRAKRIGARARFVGSLKWAPGFFPTPPPVVARMIEAADLPDVAQIVGQPFDASKASPLFILEPSTGTANIAAPLMKLGHCVRCVEIVPAMAEKLRAEGYAVNCADFLTVKPEDFSRRFDRVLMNPPYEKRQDEAHTRHAFRFLGPGGILVSLVSSPTGQRLEAWAEQTGGYVEQLGAGHFLKAERSTGVNVALVVAHSK